MIQRIVCIYIMFGYLYIAMWLPNVVLSVRKTVEATLLVASLWFILTAAVQTNLKRWDGPLIPSDALRVIGVTLFLAMAVVRWRHRRARAARERG